ncbi:MAG TPA: 5-amino-6-(D-ribitylamino)uracil--L-tyrosine 4-hydroxyphenyl transferase CofH [Actinomycetota bacterium]|nr:5-amino-6-(D-ribitylamino)uracil--L-tyrosine 4-hydroxyphenyl transferase CofH [Actinomycetota bacterium]
MGVPARSDALGFAQALARDPRDPELLGAAARLRDEGWGNVVTYSPKVFIPLTKLCRDVCHYCTFARPPLEGRRAYLSLDEVLAIARAGAAAGCREALFTLGDKPELRYRVARDELAAMGYATTVEYLAAAARAVLEDTGLLPHLNPGILSAAEIGALRDVAPSMGIMLETVSDRLCQPGQPHHGSPDKLPAARLGMLEEAGRQRVPFTTGLLIGIGETWEERVDTLLAIREAHERWGHVQEVIVQNFRAKPGTPMADHPELPDEEVAACLALARLVLGAAMSVQCPPNLASSPATLRAYLEAGINDWGGVSPVTIDHVNPEAPWPEIAALRAVTERAGFVLVPRLTVYPAYAFDASWVAKPVRPKVLAATDAAGMVREPGWHAGDVEPPGAVLPGLTVPLSSWSGSSSVRLRPAFARCLAGAQAGAELSEDDIVLLLSARGPETEVLARAADALRREASGDTVTFVVNRNINYTNMCYFRCGFCAFSKGPKSLNLRGDPYLLSLADIAARTLEAHERGATEVCLQGGIHPEFTGDFYLQVVRAVKQAVPSMHVHAFSPLEVWQGAHTKGVSLRDFLWELKDLGLGSLPGTAAEILDDEVRAVICPDKVTTAQWSEVARTAHSLGLPMTSTIMFGHVESYRAWARHLGVLRSIQKESLALGDTGFTEFVPLPFVHMASPIYLKGKARQGPTFEEAIKLHAVARLALHPWITNIQVSWVKMGQRGSQIALQSGCNDLGGTLMNENISRAAGAAHGQELVPAEMKGLIGGIGRPWARRSTLYRILETPEPVLASG